MRRSRWWLAAGVAALLGVGPAWWVLWAQHPNAPAGAGNSPRAKAPARAAQAPQPSRPRPSVQEALLQPIPLPFARETPLVDVIQYLRRTLGAPVVLDRAALDRQDVLPQDTVQLDLEGVRLKTGLKLLLGPLGLTYRVVPEDNLLVITDAQGSDNPLDLIHEELRALHRDIHSLQDTVDELRELEAPGSREESGRSMRVSARRADRRSARGALGPLPGER
jgi:hypothetical protein